MENKKSLSKLIASMFATDLDAFPHLAREYFPGADFPKSMGMGGLAFGSACVAAIEAAGGLSAEGLAPLFRALEARSPGRARDIHAARELFRGDR